jgi:hypothetical protein
LLVQVLRTRRGTNLQPRLRRRRGRVLVAQLVGVVLDGADRLGVV